MKKPLFEREIPEDSSYLFLLPQSPYGLGLERRTTSIYCSRAWGQLGLARWPCCPRLGLLTFEASAGCWLIQAGLSWGSWGDWALIYMLLTLQQTSLGMFLGQ